jgi:hypothetical protein
VNGRIVAAAWDVVRGELVVETRPMFCLKVVRQIVEHAMRWKPGEFYRRYWTHKVEENRTAEPWARDLERSLRNRGLAAKEPQAGDLVFNFRAAWPYGHVGVMLSNSVVLENTPSNRGFSRGNIRLVPLKEWGTPTTVIRLKE